MKNKAMEEIIRNEIEASIAVKVREVLKKKQAIAFKFLEEYSNSPKFEKLLKNAVSAQINYFLDDRNIDELLSEKDAKKFWQRVSKRLLKMYK